MQLTGISRIGIVLGLVAVLVCGGLVGFAFARDGATYDIIPQNTYCEGIDLSGMDAKGAAETLERFLNDNSESIVIHLVDETTGEVYDAPLANALKYDVDAAVAQAIDLNHKTPVLARLAGAEPDRHDIPLGLTVDDGALHDRIASLATELRRDPADAYRDFNDDNTVTVHPEVIGRELDTEGTFSAARMAIGEKLAGVAGFNEALAADITVPLALRLSQPGLTVDEFAPAIIVDYSEYKLRVFELDKCVWECYIGYGRGYDPAYNETYDSPTGLHYIEYKDPAPTWTNPDPDGWGAGRPDVIEAGPDNPLGLRALKISDAPMIFIHGVQYSYLIGARLSHGCINVYNDQIVELYDLLPDPNAIKDYVWVYFHDYPETSDYAEYVGYSSYSYDDEDDYDYGYDYEGPSYEDEDGNEYDYSYYDEETGEYEYYNEEDLY